MKRKDTLMKLMKHRGTLKRELPTPGTRTLPRRAGFTLIEILVTVTIIILLIGILIPTLSAAKNAAKKAATLAQMREIQKACITYHNDFNEYPGPIAEKYITGAVAAGYSGSQNMLMGLSLRWYPTPALAALSASSPPPNAIPGTTISTEYNTNLQPMSYGIYGKNGSYPAYLPFKPSDISTGDPTGDNARWPGANLFDASNNPKFPVIMDSQGFKSSAMPILYYRLANKWDPAKVNNSNQAQNGYADTPAYDNANSGNGCYYNDSNNIFTMSNPNFIAGSNATALWNLTDRNRPNLNAIAPNAANFVAPQPTTYSPRGGFVLISAGLDRIYGPDANGNSDDLIMSDE